MIETGSLSLITKLRVGIGCLLGTAILFPSMYQPVLDFTWSTLRNSSIYKASYFETVFTVFCYAAIEVPITVVFMKHPEWRLSHSRTTTATTKSQQSTDAAAKPKGMRRPSRRWAEGFTYVLPLLLLDLTLIKKFADVPLEEMRRTGNYEPELPQSRLNTAAHQHFLAPTVHNFSWDSPLQTERALPLLAPTSRRLAVELVISIVLYDALFFLFHFAMHYMPIIKHWHQPHHSHEEMHPQVTNQLHVFERLGLVLLANFALNIIKSHCLTRTIFVPIFVWLLVEIHSGMDLPWAYDKILPQGWGGGARKHAAHHHSGIGGFAPYLEWCDASVRPFIRS